MYSVLKNRFKKEVFKGQETKKDALEKAYDDMSRRATGHKPEMKEVCVKWLVDEVFCESLSFGSQQDFDSWHERICTELKNKLGNFGTIGRAQKVINMAFKYLSCIDERYDNILSFCHMTLDGYTLNWYKTINKEAITWSKIDNYKKYAAIQEDIRKHLKSNKEYSINIGNKTTKIYTLSSIPFEAEFIIWEGEIINSKYNELVKSLNKYKLEGQKKDEWLIGDIFDTYLNTDFKQ